MSNRRNIAVVVLAAGRSMRMGETNKLLADFEGKPMIERTLDNVVAAGVDDIIVVTGHRSNELRDALKSFGVRFVHNPDYREGLSTSLKAGVLGLKADGVLVVLGDMPLVEVDTLKQIIHGFENADDICVPVHQGKQGNPVLWGRDYFEEILSLDGDRGAKSLLGKHQLNLVDVETDAILRDFDLPTDFPSL